MKTYAVRLTLSAEQEIDEQVRFIAADKPNAATNWLERLSDAISDLGYLPERNPVSESESASEGCEVRKLVFGNYFIYYHIVEKENAVDVLRFRHAARLPEES